MSAPSLNARWAAAVVGEWIAAGLEHVVVCPGSRSSPLALAVARAPSLRVHPVVDERSGAFVALGIARATGRPAALVVTSGTAGANAFPAVIEAHEVGARLWVATADRPWELQGFGAAQTIDQPGLFGRCATRVDLPVPEDGAAAERHLRARVARACAGAGPVHLNVPFREPLVPAEGEAPADFTGGGLRLASTRTVGPAAEAELTRLFSAAKRPLVVCGPRAPDGLGAPLHAWAERAGIPVLAEAASNLRFGFPQAVAHYDTLLRQPRFSEQLRPDLVLRLGGGLTSKVLAQWLERAGAPAVVVHEAGALVDPAHQAVLVLDAPAAEVVARLGAAAPRPEADWRRRWAAADAVAREVFLELGSGEPMAAQAVAAALPKGANLCVASSMPIRDLDGFASVAREVNVFANRGTNGIDGTVSSAIGVALGSGRPTVLLTGDLAALHDLHGFVTARRLRPRLAVVVVNNDGGGIFHFLPVSGQGEAFERLFATPHGLGFSEAASLAGWPYALAQDAAGLRAALVHGLESGAVIELRTERGANVEQHKELHARAAAALEAAW